MAFVTNTTYFSDIVTKSGKHHVSTYWRGVTIREDYFYGPELLNLYRAFLAKKKRMDVIHDKAVTELTEAGLNKFKINEFVYFRHPGLDYVTRHIYQAPNNYTSSPMDEIKEANTLAILEQNGKATCCKILDKYYVVNQILTDICFGLKSFIERLAWSVNVSSMSYNTYTIRYLQDFGYLVFSSAVSVYAGYEVIDITELFNEKLAKLHE